MTKTEKIQSEVNKVILSITSRGWKLTRTTNKALKEAEEMGLAQYLGIYARQDVKGAAVVSAVIEAAKDTGGTKTETVWHASGDADVTTIETEASALYLALNEVEEASEEASPWGEFEPTAEGDIYMRLRGDIGPNTYESVTIINGKVAYSGVTCLSAAWRNGNDPYANYWVGYTADAVKSAGFITHTEALQSWLSQMAQQY